MRGLMIATAVASTVALGGGAAVTLVGGLAAGLTAGLTASDARAQACFPVGRRVCAFKNGRWRNYRNRCYARRANARPIRNGRCTAAANCASQGLRPVCATWRGRRTTFRNLCYARRARATNIRLGRCAAGGGGCATYVRQALGIVRAIRSKRCRVPGGYFYSANPNTQRQVCRQRTPNQRAGVLNSMRGYLQRCTPQGGPGGGDAAKREACNRYANRALAQVARARQQGCFIQGANWSPNRGVHYSYCMSRGPAAANQLAQSRQQFLGACRPN